MTPLLFISIVTLVLVFLVYWILSNLDQRQNGSRFHLPESKNLKFETAQELFKFSDPDALEEQDVLRLIVEKDHVKAYWNIRQETWSNIMKKLGLAEKHTDIIIRLYNSVLNVMDIPVNDIQGGRRIKTGEFHISYAVLGVYKRDKFMSLFQSQPIE